MQLPQGFRFGGTACQIKPSGRPDLAVIATHQPATLAGVYTQNLVCAASIDWNRSITPTETGQAIVVNSGNANACTGQRGIEDNQAMAKLVASGLGLDGNQVAVLSTGVIGRHLPMDRVGSGIEQLCGNLEASPAGFSAAANAILTTDQGPKVAHDRCQVGEAKIALVGMAKGAGMIGPNMATMLSVVCTDARLTAADAQASIRLAADLSFNRISVEGHTSTNDALLLMASGKVGPTLAGDDLQTFQESLTKLCIELAKQIPADGEGATHLIEIRVQGATDDASADRIARTVASSALVKTAVTGADPNWGRIVSAAGYSGVAVDPQQLGLEINGHVVYSNGEPTRFDAAQVSQSMASHAEVILSLTVGAGPGQSVHWTSDLTVDYVKFNSEYTT